MLEKYQFVEPRHDLIAEALWLLSDPEGYKNKVKNLGSQAAVADTVRKLKTAQSRKNTSSSRTTTSSSTKRTRNAQPTVKRKNNMFKRF